jgi:hypothetical protein
VDHNKLPESEFLKAIYAELLTLKEIVMGGFSSAPNGSLVSGFSSTTPTSMAITTSAQQIAAANSNAKWVVLENLSPTATVYVSTGGTPTTSSYDIKLLPYGQGNNGWEFASAIPQGAISFIGSVADATNKLRITVGA